MGICRRYGFDPHDVVLWCKLYLTYGGQIFNAEQNFSAPMRKRIVEDRIYNALSITETCVKYKILQRSSLKNWMHNYKTGRPMSETKRKRSNITGRESSEQDRLAILENELHLLRAENAYLKKLQALMQRRKKN